MVFNMLALCWAFILCCLISAQIEGLPQMPFNSSQMPTPPSAVNMQIQNTNPEVDASPILESIFVMPEICPPGFKLAGDPQRCRKKA